MLSLIIAIVAYAILAVVGVLDKFILEKSLPRPVVFVFYSSVFVLPVLLLLPFGVGFIRGYLDWSTAAVSGVTFALGLWAMYIAIRKSEISHCGPLIGASTAFFTLILSKYFLGEEIYPVKIAAVLILIVGSLLISFEKSKDNNGWHSGVAWGALSGLLFAASHVASKYIYDIYGFYGGFVWTRAFLGLFGLALLVLPSVRQAIFTRKPLNPAVDIASSERKGKSVILIFINKILGVAGGVLIQYAIAIGSVTLVNALAGAQYAILIVLVALLSRFAPRVFKEDFAKRELALEAAGAGVIAIGLAMIIF